MSKDNSEASERHGGVFSQILLCPLLLARQNCNTRIQDLSPHKLYVANLLRYCRVHSLLAGALYPDICAPSKLGRFLMVERFPKGNLGDGFRNTSRVWWSMDTMFNVSNGCEQAMLCQCKIRVQGITRRLSPPLAQRTELMNYTALHLSATKRSKFKFITMQGNPVYLCPINYNHKINSRIGNSTQPFVEDLTTMIIMQHQCKRSCANSAVQEVETRCTLVQWSAEGRGRAKRFSARGGVGQRQSVPGE